MKYYVRLVGGFVVDLSTDPWNCYHPILAAEFVECPSYVKYGWARDGEKWFDPNKPIEEEF